jgi:hydrogenase expression/formation protein HypE
MGDTAEAQVLERIAAFQRRAPRLRDKFVTLAHGAGGKSSAALLDDVFLPGFGSGELTTQTDAAVLELPTGERLAFTTDSYVVSPWRFAGGSVGDLAVNGTVNDLAMMGARPIGLSAAFVIEEGFAVDDLRAVVADMAAAAARAGVSIVTGDTKVVGHGAGDGVYITTAGIGTVPAGRELAAAKVEAGDAVIVSGTIADHGVAVMIARGDLALAAEIESDTAPLSAMVEDLLDAVPATRWLRDATRGGVGTVVNELARSTGLTVVLDEAALPVHPSVAGACELLGIDPLHVANEGKLVAVVPAADVDRALDAIRRSSSGRAAACIGGIRTDPPGLAVLTTAFGGTRILDMLVGDPLPRIC